MRPLWALLRREFFERVRSPGHFAMRTAYVGVLFFVIIVTAWDTILAGFDQPISHAPDMGQLLFRTFVFVQYGLVVLLVPLIGAGAIVDERAERSLQLLLLTHLSYGQIAFGKFASRLGLLALIVLSNVPVLFFAALLGGVEPMDVVRVFVLTMATGAMFLGVSLTASAVVVRSPVRAAMASYMVLVLLLVSLFLLNVIDERHFFWWHPMLALGYAVVEPLTIGAGWWQAALLNFGVGGLGVVASAQLLRRGVRRTRLFSTASEGAPIKASMVWSNPVAWREWSRKGRVWVWVGVSLGLGGVSAFLTMLTVGEHDNTPYMIGLNVLFFTACIFSLASASSAFAQEKREQTLDLLRLTYLSPWSIVIGKLVSIWRMGLYFVLWLVPPTVVVALVDDDLPLMAVPLPAVAFMVSLTFIGSVGIFYSLVSDTPMRAAFPSVATFLYVATPLFMWPMVFFQEEDAIPFSMVIGWAVIFAPPMLLMARASSSNASIGAGVLGLWSSMVLFLGIAADEAFVLFGVSPFALVNASIMAFTESSPDEFVGLLVLGIALTFGAAFFFAWASVALLDDQSRTDPDESENSSLAAFLSAVMPGAGQIYLGKSSRGGIIMVVSFLLGCGLGLANVLAAVDAYKIATREREARRAHAESRRGVAPPTP